MKLPKVLHTCLALVGLVSCHAAWASDHREAPTIYEDPTADIADLYAFTNPNNPGNLVLVLTVQPFATQANPQSYTFSKDVLYTFNIDTNEDAVADEKIDIRFSAPAFGNQKMWVKLPRLAPLQGETTWVLSALHSAPPPVINKGPSNIQYFAGLRDDPFFFDSLAGFRFFAFGEKFSTGIDRLVAREDTAAQEAVPCVVSGKLIVTVQKTAADALVEALDDAAGFAKRDDAPDFRARPHPQVHARDDAEQAVATDDEAKEVRIL